MTARTIAIVSRRGLCRFLLPRLAAAGVIVGGFAVSPAALAQVASAPQPSPAAPMPTPDEARAAHVHRFAGFVEWPPEIFSSPEAPLIVGVAGAPGVGRELELLSGGRPVQGRNVVVRELTDMADARKVHVLVIGRAAWKRGVDWMQAVRGMPVLVVTDMPKGLERGAMLAIVEVEGRLRFEASVPAAERAGLKLSARLLAVAERVLKAP